MNIFILQKELSGNLYYKNVLVTKYTIKFPYFYSNFSNYCLNKINNIYLLNALKFQFYCQTELYKNAIQQYEFSVQNGYPIMVYEGYLTYTVTYNENNILSLYFDQYQYTGGAHGMTVRYASTWNLKTCKLMTLEDFELTKEYIIDQIYIQIEEQIKNGTNQYFEDYRKLVLQTFNENNFYLTPNGIVVFFQQYDIAPYSSGIVEFDIKFERQ